MTDRAKLAVHSRWDSRASSCRTQVGSLHDACRNASAPQPVVFLTLMLFERFFEDFAFHPLLVEEALLLFHLVLKRPIFGCRDDLHLRRSGSQRTLRCMLVPSKSNITDNGSLSFIFLSRHGVRFWRKSVR